MSHTIIRSKMKKGKPLMNDPIISRHVPETVWFQDLSLKRMLRNYTSVYIKPDKGNKGKGIIRIKKLPNSKWEVSYKNTIKICSWRRMILEIEQLLNPKKKYIIQQGIDLATYHNRPFDVRIVLQKPLNRWRLTWISAKVAPQRTSIVTNVAKGAKDAKIFKTLKGIDQPLNTFKILRELIDVSFETVQILDSHFPLQIVGLDMGIDKKGKVWFIEANTKPDFGGLKKFDPKQFQTYLEAKKMSAKR